jgi:hypothetical protein
MGGEKMRLAAVSQVGQSTGASTSARERHFSKLPQVSHLKSYRGIGIFDRKLGMQKRIERAD